MTTTATATSERKAQLETPTAQIWRRFRASSPGKVGGIIVLVFIVLALLAPILKPYDAFKDRSYRDRLTPPSASHIFGTDNLGRDVATRVLHGSRISLQIGLISVSLAAVVGTLLGLIAGFFRGRVDAGIDWGTNILLAFPGTLLAIAIVAVRGPGLTNTMLAISVTQIPVYVRIARSMVYSLREQDFIHAAEALGASSWRQMLVHVLPNGLSPLIVQSTLTIGTATLEAAALGFLGLGAQPPVPEWGTMIADAFQIGVATTAPWTMIFPGLAILLTVLGFNLLGDGLRDALDPKSQRAAK